jgi:hypothetical protein
MRSEHVISAQAHMRVAHVKPRSGGRSQNYMPPEAVDALKKADAAKAAVTQPSNSSSAVYPVTK